MHLLIIFDPRTEPLVHHFLKLNRTAEVSADWILYVLAQATWAIRKRYAAIRAPQDSVSIAMPDMKDTPYAEPYAEAATRLKDAIPTGELTVHGSSGTRPTSICRTETWRQEPPARLGRTRLRDVPDLQEHLDPDHPGVQH